MSLSIGIVGLPNVGKSTLFNALTKKTVPAENYPFCTIDPSVGIVPVPDERLEVLSKISQSKKLIPAVVEFVDIAGLVKGASAGEGLGNQFLSHIRETDAIAEVVRIFEDENIIHVEGKVNPLDDIKVINLELLLADMQTVDKRSQTIGKDIKKGDKDAIFEAQVLEKLKAAIEQEKLISTLNLTKEELHVVKSLHLLTAKKFLYVLNKKAGAKNLDEINDPRFTALIEYLKNEGSQYVVVDAKIEDELKDFEGEERESFRKELGRTDGDGIDLLIKAAYKTLGLMTYLTTGEMETRAWTVEIGSTAPVAGQAIHTDFKDKFIRAEVIYWKDLVESGSFAVAKTKGLLRTEGKEYVVKDGDVIEFKI